MAFSQAGTCQGIHRKGLVWLHDEHLKLKVDRTAAPQRDHMTNTGDTEKKQQLHSVFHVFPFFFVFVLIIPDLALGLKEARPAARKNLKRQPIALASRRPRCTRTSVRTERPGGRCEGGCAGRWSQGTHGLELSGSPPPEEGWMGWKRQRE